MNPIHASLIGMVQGLLLLTLHEGIQRDWPVISDPIFWMAAYALVLIPPIIAILTAQHGDLKARLKLTLGISLLLLLTACYTGYQIDFREGTGWAAQAFTFAAVMAVGNFIFLSFAQNWLANKPLTNYDYLYQNGWKNALSIAIAVLFTGLAWMLLMLWGALFDLLNIHVFREWFSDRNFIYCATGAIMGYGIALGQQRASTGMIEHIDYLFRSLLLVVSFITILFIVALPLSGLQPLWDTKSATSLLITLQLVFVMFYNAIYQRGYAERQEHPVVKKLVETACLLLPLLSAVSIYAVWLRVDQYGWSFLRVIVALVVSVVAIYAVGYAAAVLHKGKTWMQRVEVTNITAASVLIIMAILVHTPLLDPKIIAASSLSARIIGEHNTTDADYHYLRFSLGKPGLRALKELAASSEEGIATQATTALKKQHRYGTHKAIKAADIQALTVMDMDHYFHLSPTDSVLPDSFREYIFNHRQRQPWGSCFNQEGMAECNILFADFTNNGQNDMVVLPASGKIQLYGISKEEPTKWQPIGTGSFVYNDIFPKEDRQSLQLTVKTHPLADLIVNGKVYTINARN